MNKTLLLVVIIVSSLISCTDSDPTSENTTETNPIMDTPRTNVVESDTMSKYYKIIWQSEDKRYDHATTFLIVTDKNSHQRMHELVNAFAKKLQSKKFSLDVFDNETAAQVYKSSLYGANEVNRIATKAELKLMDKHIVGAYTGELETMDEPHDIMYHGFGYEKESHETYEPNLNNN